MKQPPLTISAWESLIRPVFDFFVPPTCVLCRRVTSTPPLCHRCRPPRPRLLTPRCSACFRELGSETSVCAHCEELGSLFRHERFLWDYSPALRAIMQRMKYGPSLLLAEWLGAVLAEHYAALSLTADWAHIIPMSGTPERLAKRGFDQAEVIARTFCTKLCLSQELVNNRILARSFHAKAQADTLHRRRFANSARSLRLRKKPLPGARILLIDDVTTTGASAQQAAILLRNAGASKIDLLSLVRADAWEEYRMTRHQRVPKHLLFRPKLNR